MKTEGRQKIETQNKATSADEGEEGVGMVVESMRWLA